MEILKYGLKHGVAALSSEVEMIVIAKNIYEKTEQKRLCTNFTKREIVNSALKPFTYSWIYFYDKNFFP